ncbi:MAG: formylglycine-generating enzyme family protein [Planctomycetaceae bacterium]
MTMLLWMVWHSETAAGQDRPTAMPTPKPEETVDRFVRECIDIRPGTDGFPNSFQIGQKSPSEFELPLKEAALVHHFRICRFETTQELYQFVMGKNPSRWKGPRNSVENVSYGDVQEFCTRLTVILKQRGLIAPGQTVRLPTALEWEYCCRAGSGTRFCFGDAAGDNESTNLLDEYAWHTGNAAGNDPAVGVLKPNAWGLFDVHGYLWEFVQDPPTAPNATSRTEAASDREVGAKHEIRGGSWRDSAGLLTCATVREFPDQQLSDAVGFRCVIADVPQVSSSGGK